jgi:Flp pilus assembly protein CpaB
MKRFDDALGNRRRALSSTVKHAVSGIHRLVPGSRVD